MQKLLIILVATSLFAACSKDDTNNNPIANAATASQEKDLQQKNFTADCGLNPLDSLYTGIVTAFATSIKSSQLAYRFEGANVTRTMNFFTTADCKGDIAVKFEEQGDFNLHTDQKTADGGKAIDIDYHNLFVTPITADGVTAANAIQLCSAGDWSQNSRRDETAHAKELKCFGTQLPRHDSNIYRLDAGILYLGSPSAHAADPTQRPTSLDMNVKYIGK